MSRQTATRLILALSLLFAVAACGKSPTAPDSNNKPHDSMPWN